MNELSEFIKAHVDEINNNDFTEVYHDANNSLTHVSLIGKLTETFLDAEIEPLVYMQAVPDNCLAHSKLTSVTIPDNITSISVDAFQVCERLTNIIIPNRVTSIGDSAFGGCKGLTSVTIGNSVTIIGEGAFRYCEGLTSITIPDNVKDIHDEAFYGCSGLTNVIIGNNVTSIGPQAFSSCISLTDVVLPSSLVKIENNAFDCCINLVNIHFKGTRDQWEAIQKGKMWDKSTGNYTVYCTDGTLHKGER